MCDPCDDMADCHSPICEEGPFCATSCTDNWSYNDAHLWPRQIFAEFIGTAALVFAPTCMITSMAVTNFGLSGAAAVILVGLNFAFSLAAIIAALGHVSGGHFNPAVTIALALTNHCNGLKAILYVLAQLAGGIIASCFVWAINDKTGRSAGLGVTTPGDFFDGEQIFLAEALVTGAFMMLIMAVAVDKQYRVDYKVNTNAPLLIGLALGVGHFVLIPISGASMNPARALGPFLIAEDNDGDNTDFKRTWFAHLFAPICGAVVAALMYQIFFLDTRKESDLIATYESKNNDRVSADVKYVNTSAFASDVESDEESASASASASADESGSNSGSYSDYS